MENISGSGGAHSVNRLAASHPEIVAGAAYNATCSAGAAAIVVFTASGFSARLIALRALSVVYRIRQISSPDGAFADEMLNLALDAATQTAMIARLRDAALNYADRLQDFVCTQFMTCSADPSGSGKHWKLLETQELDVGYISH